MATTPAVAASTQRNQVIASAVAAALAGLAASQSLGAAGALSLNGTLIQTGIVLPATAAPVKAPPNPGYNSTTSPAPILIPSAGLPIIGSAGILLPAQNVVLTSAGNDTTLTWTIT